MPNKNGHTATPTVGRETLEDTPQRALKLLRAVGTSVRVRAALAARGYGEDDHQEGWTLLHAASGFAPERPFDEIDAAVRDAIRELDAWDEDGFRVVRATLERRYPDLAAEVLKGIGPSTGPEAVMGVHTLLDRLDDLEKSKTKDAHAAIALLGKRGLDRDERKRLRALVEKAESPAEADGGDDAAQKADDDQHVAALVALRAWYDEWSNIARASVKRRDHLILMGLAKRKTKARGADAPATTSPTNGKGAAAIATPAAS